jgi:Cu/Ag efflux protein CusF
MRRLSAGLIAAAVLLPYTPSVSAQTKTIPGDKVTVTATVEAVDASTRTVTLKGPKGNYVDVVAPDSVSKFSEIKVGDKVTATYYENLVLRVKLPGEKAVDSGTAAVTKASGSKPGATASTQRTITATITAIDPKVPSITFSGPHNWTYSSRVEDKKALATVKVGDKVDITWTEALLVSFAPEK